MKKPIINIKTMKKPIIQFIYFMFCLFTAIVGYDIHHNKGHMILNLIFAPISWVYWIVTHKVTLSIIKHSFEWFLQ